MFSLYRTLSLRYLRKRWGLNLLVVLSIGLGVSVWVATSALYQSLEESVLASINPLAAVADLIINNGDAGVPRAVEARLTGVELLRQVRRDHPDVIRLLTILLCSVLIWGLLFALSWKGFHELKVRWDVPLDLRRRLFFSGSFARFIPLGLAVSVIKVE